MPGAGGKEGWIGGAQKVSENTLYDIIMADPCHYIFCPNPYNVQHQEWILTQTGLWVMRCQEGSSVVTNDSGGGYASVKVGIDRKSLYVRSAQFCCKPKIPSQFS